MRDAVDVGVDVVDLERHAARPSSSGATPVSVRIVNSQSAVSTSGVGPAESTGKSRDERLPGREPVVAFAIAAARILG